jgi:hypothetical protein
MTDCTELRSAHGHHDRDSAGQKGMAAEAQP